MMFPWPMLFSMTFQARKIVLLNSMAFHNRWTSSVTLLGLHYVLQPVWTLNPRCTFCLIQYSGKSTYFWDNCVTVLDCAGVPCQVNSTRAWWCCHGGPHNTHHVAILRHTPLVVTTSTLINTDAPRQNWSELTSLTKNMWLHFWR